MWSCCHAHLEAGILAAWHMYLFVLEAQFVCRIIDQVEQELSTM